MCFDGVIIAYLDANLMKHFETISLGTWVEQQPKGKSSHRYIVTDTSRNYPEKSSKSIINGITFDIYIITCVVPE